MSSELFINIDTTKKSNTDNLSSGKTEKKEKSEGGSLFASLMNEAKNDTVEDTIETAEKKSTQNNTEAAEKKSTQNNTEAAEKKSTQNNTEAAEKKSTQNNIKIESLNINNTDGKKNTESLQKMVEKLVDIVVSAAKEVLDKKNTNESEASKKVDTKDLSDILKLKESKVVDSNKTKEVVSNLDKKIVTIDESVEKIEKNTIALKEDTASNKDFNNKKELKNQSEILIKGDNSDKNNDVEKELNTLDNQKVPKSKDEIDSIKEHISKEVSIIKEAVQGIKVDVSEIKKVTSDIQISDSSTENTNDDKEIIKKVIENNAKISANVDSGVDIIDDSVKLIKAQIDGVDTKNSNKASLQNIENNQVKIELDSKLEHKVEVIKEVLSDIKEQVSNIVIVKTTETESSTKKQNIIVESKVIVNADEKNSTDTKTPLLASMFLNSQQNVKEKTSLKQINDAKTNITEKKTVEAIKESAKDLELNLEDTEIEQKGDSEKKVVLPEVKKENVNTLFANRTLNQVLINQKIEATQQIKEQNIVVNQKEEIAKADQEKKNMESVELIVPRETVISLQNKIIGAQQRVGSFMSDVARSMYLNYKPPVTAFRVNLNPANLGSISIIMKANKIDNSLSVSMNLSNSNTMEAFSENKNALQNAIQRQFNDTSNVSISFGMQDQNSENTFNQFQQEQNENRKDSNESEKIAEEDIEEQEIIDNNDYM